MSPPTPIQAWQSDWCTLSKIPIISSTTHQLALLRTSLQNFQSLRQLLVKHLKSPKGYANHFLDAARPVSNLVVAHLNTYCNCCVNKMLVFISLHFLFFAKPYSTLLHSTLLYKNCPFLRAFQLILLFMFSRALCVAFVQRLRSFAVIYPGKIGGGGFIGPLHKIICNKIHLRYRRYNKNS